MERRLWTAAAAVLISIVASTHVRAQGAPVGHGKQHTHGATASAPAEPNSQEKAGREAFEKGRVFYDSGAFDQAAASFEEAYRLTGRDALLYNIYLAYRDANQPAKAAEALRGFLAKVPNIENRAQLESRLAALDAGLAREREQREAQATASSTAAAPVAAPVENAPAPSSAAKGADARSNKRFWAGVSLAGVGGALMLTSIVTGVLAHQRAQELSDGCQPDNTCPASLRGTADSGKTLAHTTDALLFGGLAVAGTGAVLLFVFGGWEQRPTAAGHPELTASCSRTGCLAQTTLRF
jgi:tetratricopeptide (TPR) repeat protein